MSTLLLTLVLAFAIVIVAVGLMAIGWVVTGKSRIQPGACGRDPHQKRNEKECGTSVSCSLCEKNESETKKSDSEEIETKEGEKKEGEKKEENT